MTEEKEPTLTISASRVETYNKCPRKYYYRYIEKLPLLKWDHLDLGLLAHGVLEYFHEELRTDTDLKSANIRRIMKESFNRKRTEMEKEGIVPPEILLEARDLLFGYLKGILNNGIDSEIIFLENEFTLDLNKDFQIKGVIDRIDKDKDGIFHIKDYKTNKKTQYMTPFQLCVYGIFLLDKYPDITKFRGSYIMLRFDGMLVSYDFTIEDVNKVKKQLIEYASRISNEERWISKPTKLCDWCDFKDICLNTW